MNQLIARARVVATAAVTWLLAVAVVLAVVADELAVMIGADHPAVTTIITVIAWIGVAISIIRRVTPALPAAHGLLPPPAEIPTTVDEARLMDQLADVRRSRAVRGEPPI